jgi:hypothetical protein
MGLEEKQGKCPSSEKPVEPFAQFDWGCGSFYFVFLRIYSGV